MEYKSSTKTVAMAILLFLTAIQYFLKSSEIHLLLSFSSTVIAFHLD